MLIQAFEFTRQVFTLTQQTQQNEADIAALSAELKAVQKELTEFRDAMRNLNVAVELMAYEIQRVREENTHQREIMELR